MRVGDAVRTALVDDEPASLDFFVRSTRVVIDRLESNVFLWLPCIPWLQKELIQPCDTFAPGRLKPKNGPVAISR